MKLHLAEGSQRSHPLRGNPNENRVCEVCLAVLTLVLSLPAMARRPTGGGTPDPAARSDLIAGYLNLSDSQKEQTNAIFGHGSADREAMRGKRQSARESNQADFEIDQPAVTIGTLAGQGIAARAKDEKKFYATLTDEQKWKPDTLPRQRGPGGNPGGGRPAVS